MDFFQYSTENVFSYDFLNISLAYLIIRLYACNAQNMYYWEGFWSTKDYWFGGSQELLRFSATHGVSTLNLHIVQRSTVWNILGKVKLQRIKRSVVARSSGGRR